MRTMLIGTVDEPPTREAAEAFLLRWTSGLPVRLAWFEREVARLGGPASTYESDLCVPLLALVVEHIGDDGGVDLVPEWYRDVHRRHGWSPYGAGLVEGLMAFVTEVYRRQGVRTHWVLDTDPRDAHYLQPVFEGHPVPPPWTQVIGAVSGIQRGKHGVDRLRQVVEHSLRHWRERHGEYVDPGPEVVPVDLAGWDYQVSLPDEVVDGLAPEVYAALEDRLGAIPGVEAALFEDREVCLLRTRPGTTRSALRAAVESVLTAASGEQPG
jgi:hypothetical protein